MAVCWMWGHAVWKSQGLLKMETEIKVLLVLRVYNKLKYYFEWNIPIEREKKNCEIIDKSTAWNEQRSLSFDNVTLTENCKSLFHAVCIHIKSKLFLHYWVSNAYVHEIN